MVGKLQLCVVAIVVAAGSVAAGSVAAGSVAADFVAAGSVAAGSVAAGSVAAGSVADEQHFADVAIVVELALVAAVVAVVVGCSDVALLEV